MSADGEGLGGAASHDSGSLNTRRFRLGALGIVRLAYGTVRRQLWAQLGVATAVLVVSSPPKASSRNTASRRPPARPASSTMPSASVRLASREAVAVLGLALTPDRGQALSHTELVDVLRRAGRRRQVDACAATIQAVLASQQREAPALVAAAYGRVVAAAMTVIASLSEQIAAVKTALGQAFSAHRDAGIVQSQPGLGVVLGARVLAEFGDDPHRYASAKARKAYAGTAPITRASGLRQVVLARSVGNRRLTTACHLWAFAALTGSPGARRYYDAQRARGATHHQALRALGNRLVSILHGCLHHRQPYNEQIAWPTPATAAA